MDHAVDAKTVLGLFIINRVAAGDARAGLDNLVVSPMDDIAQQSQIKKLGWKHHQIQGGEGASTHGIYI